MHINLLSSIAVVAVLLTSSVGAFRHDGKSHNHPNRRLLPRQVGPDGHYGGGQQSPPSSPQVFPIPTPPPPAGTMSTTVVASNSPVVPKYTVAVAAAASGGANGTDAVGWSYVFPTTVIQVPVATLCPGGGAEGPPLFTMAPASNTSVTEIANEVNNAVTDYVPLQVNATATLPGGKTTVFLSTSSSAVVRRGRKMTTSSTSISISTPDPAAASASASATASASNDMARIILDPSGCQTVYSPLTTQLCSTIVNPGGGMLPVQITDCDQWVTFSSERLSGGGGGRCSTTVTIGAPDDEEEEEEAGNRDASETGIESVDGGEATTSTSAWTATFTDPTAFYAAHWYDLVVASAAASPASTATAAGAAVATTMVPSSSAAPIPTLVRVENCFPFTTGSTTECMTSSERWSVTSTTRTTTESKLVTFEGLAAITSGTIRTTTTLSLSTILTMTSVVTDSSIVRSRIGESTSVTSTAAAVDSTVTIAMSTPTTKTWFVEAVSHTPSTDSMKPTATADPNLRLVSTSAGQDDLETTTTVVVKQTMTTMLQVTETKTHSVPTAAITPTMEKN
ncbi:uncharacterized protein PV06_03373 [Exophiala oligosperma]|uniref:Ig-like domain-containing protein n=1 Tax=Exophiala oligosperma TaxID=215243 RepID=A0A0D2EAE5_9EURO|nr:uncharacterized protein PV06_03373 [Exophiala oligosperma]KIW44939.1 hypothetical protein PV06_03373 [Exophiala oligosperma]